MKKETSELFTGMHITALYRDHGENINFQESVNDENCKKALKLLGVGIDALTAEHPVTIKLITPKAHREACIDGVIFGEGVSRKVAENIVDGVEMTDEEFNKLNDDDE